MKRSELRTRTRVKLDDTVEPYLWSDDFLNDALNEAVQEANLRARFLVDSTTPAVAEIAVVAGQATYALHPSVIVMRRAEWLGSVGDTRARPLERRSFDELDRRYPHWRSLTGPVPHIAVQDFDQRAVVLHPIPTAPGTIRLTVWRHPLESEQMDSDADEPAIPDQYHRRLVDWVCSEAYTNKDAELLDEQKSAQHLAAFETEYGPRPTIQMLRRLAVDHVDESESYYW